jgi:hypothetical protein
MSLLGSAEIRALLDDAAGRAGHYLAGLDERPVAPDDAAGSPAMKPRIQCVLTP